MGTTEKSKDGGGDITLWGQKKKKLNHRRNLKERTETAVPR